MALSLLFLGALGIGFSLARLDHFLVLWDEQYHALVAKHMIGHPFKPTLFEQPLLSYDFKDWTSNHIWLHKQPLFLWQIALSLKFFGYNALAVRIPSILMHAIIPILIYRIGKIASNTYVAFYGALFFALTYYPLELVAGKYPTDHNDVAFLFYVAASFWAWFEYQDSKRKYWLILIGIFSGCAVLVKWLVGLLIYAVWFITLGVEDRRNWLKVRTYYPFIRSFLMCVAVFLPWQLYIFYAYPMEADYEFKLNGTHFFSVIEQHSGTVWFHWNALKEMYGAGDAVPFILLLSVCLLLKKMTSNIYRVAIAAAILITYVFYTLAATKMISFCIIVAPLIFLALGELVNTGLNMLLQKIRFKKIETAIRVMMVAIICFLLLDINKIEDHHTLNKVSIYNYREADLKQMALIEKIKLEIPGDKRVIFNTGIRANGHIALMFFTNHIAYDFIPTEIQLAEIKKQCYSIAIVDNHHLPDFILKDPSVFKIRM